MGEELKRCPFCGGKVSHQVRDILVPETVFCLNCPVAVPTNIWQQRPIEDELRAEIEEMKAKTV